MLDLSHEPRREKAGFLHMRKQRRRSASRLLTAKLISAFVFANYIVHSLYFLNPKFRASNHLLWLYQAVQPGLCGTWSETPKTGFLTTRLILELIVSGHVYLLLLYLYYKCFEDV